MKISLPAPATRPGTTSSRKLLPILISLSMVPLGAQPAIPEPPVVFYGQITPSSPAPDLSAVTFTLAGNGETITTTIPARVVTVEGISWYIVSIPFETRAVQGGPVLTATSGTLAVTSADTTYTVSARVGATAATLPEGKTTLVYGAERQGLIDRMDLTLGGETFAAWSQRIFGSLVSQTDDADRDGQTNYEEYIAGTDPKNPQSSFMVKRFTPAPGGGFTFTWDSLPGKTYQTERSSNLKEWSPVGGARTGTGSPLSMTDLPPNASTRFYYRVTVSSQ